MVKFPYREEGNPPILRPTVDVRLACEPNGEWTTRALIDTGSPLTIFDRGVAEALCLRIGHLGAETGSIALLGRLAASNTNMLISAFRIIQGLRGRPVLHS